MSAVLRRQAVALQVTVPFACGGVAYASVSADAWFAGLGGVLIGFVIGVCLAQRLEAAASALDCQVEIAELLRGVTTLLTGNHAQNKEALRLIHELVVSGNTRNLNAAALARADAPANANSG